MTFVAVYDANALCPSTLRDVLIRIALGGLVQAKWTEEALVETFRDIEKNRPDLDPQRLGRTRQLLGAQVIVTFNVKDFPADELAKWSIEIEHPDDFLVDQFCLDGPAVHRAIQAIADAWTNPPGTAQDVLNSLERDGLPQITALLRRELGSGP